MAPHVGQAGEAGAEVARMSSRDRAMRLVVVGLLDDDPAKAKAIRESALFYTRQRTTDLLTQMAVTVQGYLALDLVKKNNVELVKGVDRASTTTVSALRTAVDRLRGVQLVSGNAGSIVTVMHETRRMKRAS